MKITKNFLAIDYGASNGRAIIGKFDGKKIEMKEVHRFENRPVYINGILYWDIVRLFSELKNSIVAACKKSDISSIGVDTYGCDFAILDKDKEMISNPVHYRDKRTIGMRKEISKIIPEKELYKETQAQIIEMASIYQLYSLRINKKQILENGKYFLMLNDLLNFFLTGIMVNEYTNATTTIAMDQKSKKWHKEILKRLDIPTDIFLEIAEPGTIIGKLKNDVCEELSIKKIPVSLPAYDTAGEIFAVPISNCNRKKNWAYLNCGTWAILGIVLDFPLVNDEGYNNNFGNEGGPFNKYHFLTNMAGMWIIQQCRKKWIEEMGRIISYDEIMKEAINSKDKNIFININDHVFEREIFDMPGCIRKYCKNKKQEIPGTFGEVSRVFYESLALKYALNITKLSDITGNKIELLHIVGGGSKDKLLCQYISNASGLPIIAGPAETTTMGNLVCQTVATGDIKNVDQARDLIENSSKFVLYEPCMVNEWQFKMEKFIKFLEN